MMKSVTPRDIALQVLNKSHHKPHLSSKYLNAVFLQFSPGQALDCAFTLHLIQGVFRWKARLDWIIKSRLNFSFNKLQTRILNILRIAVYQIFFMDRVPDSAAVDEAVKQAKKNGRKHLSGFVNGILRSICRQRNQIAYPERQKDQVEYLSVYYSYPPWLAEKWIRETGADSAELLMESLNHAPSIIIRRNRLKIRRSTLIKCLASEGVIGKPTHYSPDGIELNNLRGGVSELIAFKKGLFQVQGEAAQISSFLLDPRPEELILDVCAGLGGKTTHLAEITGGKAFLYALDKNYGKLIKQKETSVRLGINCIQSIVADAEKPLNFLFRKPFDKILIDGPCSALGILHRHPDGKWSRDESTIKHLPFIQKKLLMNTVPLLRNGGSMIYLTCTISQEENEGLIQSFLDSCPEMNLIDLKKRVPENYLQLIDENGFYKTLPYKHGMEGFFGALFRKN